MKKLRNRYNALLALGFVFFFAGILLLVFFLSALPLKRYILRPLVFLVAGSVILYRVLISKKRALLIFTGLFLCCTGILFLIVDARLIPFSILQIWPILVISSGLLLWVSGYIRYKRLRASYIVPGLALAGLGFVFLCFSLDIITISFAEFARQWWPLVFTAFGSSLIGLFFYSQARKNSLLPDESDEDEDLT